MRKLVQSTATAIAVSACSGGFFLNIDPVPSTNVIDGSEDWLVSFGNIRQLINHDDSCWAETPALAVYYYDNEANAVEVTTTGHTQSGPYTEVTLEKDAFMETGSHSFELCFEDESGSPRCSATFTLNVCVYEDLSPPAVMYNVWTGADNVDFDGWLQDSVGSGFTSQCYRYSNKIIYQQLESGNVLYDGATVSNWDVDDLRVAFSGRNADVNGGKGNWVYAICIPKFYTYGRHCVYDGAVTEKQCDPSGFNDGFDFTEDGHDATMPDYEFMDREASLSMDFGTLKAELYTDSDCDGTIDSDTNFLYQGDTAVDATNLGVVSITQSTPKAVIQIMPDSGLFKQTSRMWSNLRVCFPIAAGAMGIQQTKVCTRTFNVMQCGFATGSPTIPATVNYNIHDEYEYTDSSSITDIVGSGYEDCLKFYSFEADPVLKLTRNDDTTTITGDYMSATTAEFDFEETATPPTSHADVYEGSFEICHLDRWDAERCTAAGAYEETWDPCGGRTYAAASPGADKLWIPANGETFDFGGLRAGVNSDGDCWKSPAAGGVYKVDGATAIDRAFTGGSFSATDTQFAFAADAGATSGSTVVRICYEKAVAYDATADAALFEMAGEAELACTAPVSIINCVYDDAVALSAITHNTAFETEVDLAGLRDSILDTDACWAPAVGTDANNKPRILEMTDGSIVDHTVDTASGPDSVVTLAAYNRDAAGAFTIPGYDVKACFDNYAGDTICSAAAALTETFDECPKAFDLSVLVSGTYKWDVRQAVTFSFGAIRDSVHDETDNTLSPSGPDNLRCWVAATDGVLFFTSGTPVPGQTIDSQSASSTVVTLAAADFIETSTESVQICFEKKTDNSKVCTEAFSLLACNFDTTVTVSDIAHNTPYALYLDYGDVRDQINNEDDCFWEYQEETFLLHGSADNGDCIDDPTYYDDNRQQCSYFDQYPSECGDYDDYNYWFDANFACCACGGGSTNSLSFGQDVWHASGSSTDLYLAGRGLGNGPIVSPVVRDASEVDRESVLYKMCFHTFNGLDDEVCTVDATLTRYYYIGFEAYSNDILNGLIKDLNYKKYGPYVNHAVIKEWPAATLNALSVVDLSTNSDSITDWEAENPFKITLLEGTTLVVQLGSRSDSSAALTELAGKVASTEALYKSGTEAGTLQLHKFDGNDPTPVDATLTPQGRVVWAESAFASRIYGTQRSQAFDPDHSILPAYSFTVGPAGSDYVAAIKFCSSAADDTACRVTSIVVSSFGTDDFFGWELPLEQTSNENVAISQGLSLSDFETFNTAEASKTACSGCDDRVTLYDMTHPSEVFSIEAAPGERLSWKATGSATIAWKQPTQNLDGEFVENTEETCLLRQMAVNPAAAGSVVLGVDCEPGDTAYGGLEYTDGTDVYTTGVKVTVVERSSAGAKDCYFMECEYPGVTHGASGNDGSRTNNQWDADVAGQDLTVRDWANLDAAAPESDLLTGAWYDTPANHKLWADPTTGLRRGDHFSFQVDTGYSTVTMDGYWNDEQPGVAAVFVQDISDHSSMDGLNKLEIVALEEHLNYDVDEDVDYNLDYGDRASYIVTTEPEHFYLLKMPADCVVGENYYAAFRASINGEICIGPGPATTPHTHYYYSAVKIECEETLVFSTIESFEAALTADYPTKVHYQTVVASYDGSTSPHLANTQTYYYQTNKNADAWVTGANAIVAEFDDVRNGDVVAFKFDLPGRSKPLEPLDMPGAGNYLSFNSFTDFSVESTAAIDTTAYSWTVPLNAQPGDVFYGGLEFTLFNVYCGVFYTTRYLSVRVQIAEPTLHPEATTWASATNPTLFDAALQITTLPAWMKTADPVGWVLESGNYLEDLDPIIDGETIGITFDNADWSVEVLPIDADTAGAGHASICELHLYGQVDTRNTGADVYPAFAFRVPVGTLPSVNCYAAFKLTVLTGSTVYYGALAVSVVVPNIQTNQPWWDDLPHSAAGYTPETSTIDSGYYADAFDAATVTISYTRQAGEYVVFSFQRDVTLIPRPAHESDAALRDLEVVSAVIPTNFYGNNDWRQEQAWPHLLFRVPTDAVAGDKIYGSIEIDAGAGITRRFALVEVTVSKTQVMPSVASVENRFFSDGTNFVTNDVSPSNARVWTSGPDWATPNLVMNVDPSTESFYIFDVGADSELDLSPKDSFDQQLNAPIFDAFIIQSIEVNQASLVRERTAHVLAFAGTAADLAGLTFYLTLKTTADDRYWSVALTFQRSFAYSVESVWLSKIAEPDRFGNYEIMEYSEVDKYMMRGTETTHIVAEVPLATNGMLALAFSGRDWSASDMSITPLAAETLTDEIGNLWNQDGVAEEHSHLTTSDTISQDKLGFAWAVPEDATVGSAYYVGVSAETAGVVSTGVWRIVVVSSRSTPFETADDFEAALVAGTSTYKYDSMDDFSDSPVEAAKFPVERLELASGKALAIQIDIRGVTATAADPYKAVDQFGGLLNDDGKVLLASSIVATRSPALFDAASMPDEPEDEEEEEEEAEIVEDETPAGGDEEPEDPALPDEAEEPTADGADQPDEGDEAEEDDPQPPAEPVESAGSSQLKAAEGDDPADPAEEEPTEPVSTDEETTEETTDLTPDTIEETTPAVIEAEEDDDEPTVTWSPLSAEATRYIYPSFAWVVPASAATGEVLYVQVNVAKGSSDLQHDNYFGVFEVTVIAPAQPVEEEEIDEEQPTSLVTTVVIVAGVVAVAAAIFYFFIM